MENDLRSAESFDDVIAWYQQRIKTDDPGDYQFQILYTETRTDGREPEIRMRVVDQVRVWDGPDYPVED